MLPFAVPLRDDAVIIIPDEPIPMAGIFDSGTWCWADLVITLLAFATFVALVALMGIRFMRSNTGVVKAIQELFLGSRAVWIILATLATMVNIFLFAFLQDLHGVVLVVDRWSPIVAVLYAGQLLASLNALRLQSAEQAAKSSADNQTGRSGAVPERVFGELQPIQAALPTPQRLRLRNDSTGQFVDDDKDE